jgi:chromosomal replication initiation ATPase DnaA
MNTKEQAELLIDKVCEYYKIKRSALTRKDSTRPVRLVVYYDGKKKVKVSLASIRMALSHYLNTYTNIPLIEIGPMCGYQDHSTIIYNRKKADTYIKCEDYLFYPYWLIVNKIANEIGMNEDFVRRHRFNFIHMMPKIASM